MTVTILASSSSSPPVRTIHRDHYFSVMDGKDIDRMWPDKGLRLSTDDGFSTLVWSDLVNTQWWANPNYDWF